MNKELTQSSFVANSVKASDIINNDSIVSEIECNGVKVKVLYTVGVTGVFNIVKRVSELIYGKDGEFRPEIIEALTKAFIIGEYTDVDISDDIETMFSLVYGTDLYNLVSGKINQSELSMIERAVKSSVDHAIRIESNTVNAKCYEMLVQLSDMYDQLCAIFDSVKNEDVKKVLSALSNGKIDEEKLMKAYLKNKK